MIDAIFLVTPAAAASGLTIGVARSVDHLGLQTAFVLLAGMLGSLFAARAIGVRSWSRLRVDTSRPVIRRAALGVIVALACYGAAFAGWLAIALLIGLGRR